MKHLLFILISLCFTSLLMAQSDSPTPDNPYAETWAQIDSLMRLGRPQSAYDLVKELRAEIQQDLVRNPRLYPHHIKAVVVGLSLNSQLQENGSWEAIQALEKEMAVAKEPEQSIYQSYLAEQYHQYWQRNSWQIRNRTERPAAEKTTDPTTWTAADLLDRVNELYLASVAEPSLRNHDIAELQALLATEDKGFDLLPTIYDLLLHRAINYYRYNDAFVNEPAYEPDFQQAALLAPVTAFVALELPYADERTSFQNVVSFFQEALRWSLANRPASRAHLDLDLVRLEVVYQQLTNVAKHAAYEDALTDLMSTYQGDELQAYAQAALMKFYYERGSSYAQDDPATEPLRWYWQQALDLATDLQERFPQSPALQDAQAIVGLVTRSQLNIAVEQVQLPDEAGLLQLSYRNLETVHFKLISVAPERTDYRDWERFMTQLLERKADQSWSVKLPNAGDYRQHTTEQILPALPSGKYFLLASAKPDFPVANNQTNLVEFWVSDLAVIFETDPKEEEIAITVVSRTAGEPVTDAEVKLWEQQRRRQIVMSATERTDTDGRVVLKGREYRNVMVQVSKEEDQLFLNEGQYLSTNLSRDRNERELVFFTDRGLYRPGQTVYFKALLLESNQQVPQIVPNEKVEVSLYDVNRQEVSKLQLRTNRYGSVSGQFTLPSGGLLGRMSLLGTPGKTWHSIRVEEYKRPRFEVILGDLADEPQLNGTVNVRGNAQAYAGPAVGGASVKYTITRSVRFPWAYPWFRSYYYQPQEKTVAVGTTKSDEQGVFSFSFTAEADADLKQDQNPLYLFQVQVEVVDGTGETRTGNKTIQLTANPFQLQLSAAATQSRSQGLQLQASCSNLDGQDLTKTVHLRVLNRRSPERTYIERYWSFPDTVSLRERDFRRNLPQYAYARNELETHWPDGEVAWEQTLELTGADTIAISTTDWAVGHYKAELIIITPDGDTLKKATNFSLHDWSTGEFAVGQWVYWQRPQSTLQPGDKAKLELRSGLEPIKVWGQWRNRRGLLQKKWLETSANSEHTLKEADRGGLAWQGTYVFQNRFYRINEQWQVPWSNKNLQVEYERFRSQLYPDQDEEWTMRISGPDGEAIAAEVLASMYDASLDQILPFQWNFNPYPYQVNRTGIRATGFQQVSRNIAVGQPFSGVSFRTNTYPQLFPSYSYGYVGRGSRMLNESAVMAESMSDQSIDDRAKVGGLPTRSIDTYAATTAGVRAENVPPPSPSEKEAINSEPPLKVRTNLQETAFFFPQLATDEQGRVVLKFRTPESLTRWRLQLFTHDEDLAFALKQKEVVTQKELMILPNAPRFLREGDQIRFTAKVSNLAEQALKGQAKLELFSLENNQDLNETFGLNTNEQAFVLDAESSQTVTWTVKVPVDATGTLGYRVVARAGNFSDGEEAALPVLTNRVLLTEAQPLFARSQTTTTFDFATLLESDETVDHQAFQLHITSNPAWEAIKALPYLQEYPYDCTEQIVNRLFANTLASKVMEDYPQAKDVFESWRRSAEGLKSPLETNTALKSALLVETPWVQDAQAETLQRQRIALLFDTDRLAIEGAVAQKKLLDRQQSDGGFSWFPQGRTNIYMTQYVAEQLFHLRALTGQRFDLQLNTALTNALDFCDRYYQERYELWQKDDKNGFPVGPQLVHYLYLRSLSSSVKVAGDYTEMWAYSWEKSIENWLSYGLFEQALLGQAASLSNREEVARIILTSLRERAFASPELGRYWRQSYGFYWYQNPIETQAKLIEFFQQMGASEDELAEMKIWLLRNKETNRWETTKATAAAIYALVTTGQDWFGETTPLEVSFPNWSAADYEQKIAQAAAQAEAGTGAYQVQWTGAEVRPQMGKVRLRNRSQAPGWGALYWQYFQTIDQVARDSDNGLRVERALYRRVNEGEGDQLQALDGELKPGDRISVRLTIRTDRDLEFVHLKDLRASGLEPVEQLSQYRYQGGLGYYQQSTDLGTHFFFDYLPKGEYVLEFDLRVFHAGDFSGGLSTIQCMYAPKFTSHSEGKRLVVPEQ